MVSRITRISAVPAAVALALVAGGCSAANEKPAADTPAAASDRTLSGNVKGAGASTQKVAHDAWTAKFSSKHPNVSMSYSPIGSGGGRERFRSGAVAYAGTDEAVSGDELDKARQRCGGPDALIEIPIYLSPIAVAYHLPGVTDLKLTPAVLAKIFTGTIDTWNDPAIAKTNPDADLPDTPITPVHRSDESGTSGNFTDYLAEAAGQAWPYGNVEKWPAELNGESAQGTSGVVKVAGRTPGAITYADAGQVRDDGPLNAARVEVGNDFIGPTSQAAAKILADSPRRDSDGRNMLTFDLNRATNADDTYPIVLASYALACTQYDDKATATIVKKYLDFVAGEQGQKLAAKHSGSAPLTAALRGQERKAIDAING